MRAGLLLFWLLVAAPYPAAAQAPSTDWVAQKCAAYDAAWQQALDGFDANQINYGFIAGNENFIASGCTDSADICPRSDTELAIANALTLALMNAGTASTFLPFGCPPLAPVEGGWTGPGL
jgi:hypothetical protein